MVINDSFVKVTLNLDVSLFEEWAQFFFLRHIVRRECPDHCSIFFLEHLLCTFWRALKWSGERKAVASPRIVVTY